MEQKLIAKGGTADIYDLGNGTFLSVFMMIKTTIV